MKRKFYDLTKQEKKKTSYARLCERVKAELKDEIEAKGIFKWTL
jgi:hypothetical protein